MSEDLPVGDALDAALASQTSMRRVIATVAPSATRREVCLQDAVDGGFDLDATFDALLGRAVGVLGEPVFDERLDRAAIDTWYPGAVRFAAWPHPDGLVFLAAERAGADETSTLLVGHATNDEVEGRRRYRGHVGSAVAADAAVQAAPMPTGIATVLGTELAGLVRRRPEGLNRLSQRRRDRLVRWLLFALAVAFLIGVTAALIIARRP